MSKKKYRVTLTEQEREQLVKNIYASFENCTF